MAGFRFWIVVAFLAGALFAAGCGGAHEPASGTLDVADVLSADTTGYARADGPRTFSFPEDHGPHPGFRTEWWYYTGNLTTDDGRRFGYQFTIFRSALTPDTLELRRDEWRTNQLYMGHLGVTDAHGGRFISDERFSRGGAGLAGAEGEPYRVWLEDWEVVQEGPSFERQRIAASTLDVGLEFELTALKPIVLQGEDGYDRKGAMAGDASYYYSVPRWATTGTIRIGSESVRVSGTSWLDREWSTGVLGEGVVGWDWFALQLSDGTDLMYYQLRDDEGEARGSGGALVGADGRKRDLPLQELRLTATGEWTSPRGGTYPSGWRLEIPSENIVLLLDPVLKDQEMDVSVRYWEGAIDVTGEVRGQPVSGVGYAELTGYASSGSGASLSRN